MNFLSKGHNTHRLVVAYCRRRQGLFSLFVFFFGRQMILNDFHSNFRLQRPKQRSKRRKENESTNQFFQLIVQLLLFIVQLVDGRRSHRRSSTISIHFEIGDVRILFAQFRQQFFLSREKREMRVDRFRRAFLTER